ncbi:uncharacterized protein ACHE_60018A [Aspergillus chevalieri]|uniref:FAD binding domain protein n=1 Tax=Aspergillus chevalieri TaxID=182096 RepID=A0A7R7VSR4_ASPCH|nr:uncharacterized protein ACHE_60018A [Aspergillus chevalieri]BCR90132.1 hypothetical protein ACHE_60018A [Aspergillus chevalieri]
MPIDLLIVGAGPAGLLAACWASQYPISTRIIDKNPSRKPTGHADGIHSRTLEILDSFGIVDRITRLGAQEIEMCYWGRDEKKGQLQREKRLRSQPEELSPFSQRLLNQGIMEEVMIDYLRGKGVEVEWSTAAESLEMDHDDLPVVYVSRGQVGKDIISARYMIACDGARSWTRDQLHIPMDSLSAPSEESIWGVMDFVPISDFPDIRQSCAIHACSRSGIMQLPRENRLIRLYIQLKHDDELGQKAIQNAHDKNTPKRLLQIAQRTYEPYRMDFKRCDWWSLYHIGQRLVQEYRIRDRIFLAGDAAHTHSPKGGQGMNVSMQDTYNLVWKLASVILGRVDPSILETYNSERRPVAQELMRMDSDLVHAYEQQPGTSGYTNSVDKIREQYTGFMTGVKVKYSPNVLIADNKNSLARNIELGMRLPSFRVVHQASACPLRLAERLVSNGFWRVLVFSGDLREDTSRRRLDSFAEAFKPRLETMRIPIEVLLIHSSSRTDVSILNLPDIFHPFDETLGWDYSRVFADKDAYEGYGVKSGCVVVCRPDQHVGWIGVDVDGLNEYFSFVK